MVKNSDQTYGQIITDLMSKPNPGNQEVGETMDEIGKKAWMNVFKEAIEGNKNVKGKYYIWIFAFKDPICPQALRIRPFTRKTRPSPYQEQDHYLYSYDNDSGKLEFHWCVPRKEVVANVLKNPYKYPSSYVDMLTQFQKGELV